MSDSTKSSLPQPEIIVVVYTKDQAITLGKYLIGLHETGKQALPVLCEDRKCFLSITSSLYSRIDILVNESLCSILMEEDFIHQDVRAKLKEYERNNKRINVVNMFHAENENFSDLFHQIPRKTRTLIEWDQYKGTVPGQVTPDQDTTGITGGKADRSNVAGSAQAGRYIFMGNNIIMAQEAFDAKKEDQKVMFKNAELLLKDVKEDTTAIETNTFQLIVNFSKEIKEKVISEIVPTLSMSEGVQSVQVKFGSIIITLTLEREFIITEEWKHTILRSIFSGQLGSCLSEGETLSVTIQRYILYDGNIVPSLYEVYANSLLHNGGVTKTELSSQTDLLQSKISKLEEELERIHMADAKWMLLMKRDASTEDDTTSGFHSAAGSTEDSDTGRGKSTEDEKPPGPLNWDIEDGDTKIMFTNNNDMLNEACRSGKVKIVKGILSSDRAYINNRGDMGWTPVLISVWAGNKQLFDVLVMAGCDVSVKLDCGNNILHVACFGGNVDIVNYIISNKLVDIESKGMYGRTAVMKTAPADQKTVFDFLVSHGCNLSGVDDDGNNILHLACAGGSVDIVQYILTHNIAGVDSKGQLSRTPVMLAAEKGQNRVFDLLVGKGCHLSGVDDIGNNILHCACIGGSVDIVQYILTHNIAGVDSKGFNGRTPVMVAAEKGQKRVFDFLVRQGCSLSSVDDEGFNILHLAAMGGNVRIVIQILTDQTVDINSRVQNNWTPLQAARWHKHDSVIKLLIERGAVDT